MVNLGQTPINRLWQTWDRPKLTIYGKLGTDLGLSQTLID